MSRRKLLSPEEVVTRYTESAIISALRLKRYWERKGLAHDEAVSRAVKQAVNMIIAGSPEKLPKILEDLDEITKLIREKMFVDCSFCAFMPALHLHREDEIREDAGGELRILQLTLKSRVGAAIYHNTGGLIGCLEDIIIGSYKEILQNALFMHIFFWHSLRDLKASAFLAFCGRYKQATATLRSALELFFTGIYLQHVENRKGTETADTLFDKWLKRKREARVFIDEGKKASVEIGLLDKEQANKVGKLWGLLSKAVHTLVMDEYEIVSGEGKFPARPASAFFNEGFLKQWFGFLLDIVKIEVKIIKSLPIMLSEKSINSIRMITKIIEKVESSPYEPHQFVKCPKLGGFYEKNLKEWEDRYDQKKGNR